MDWCNEKLLTIDLKANRLLYIDQKSEQIIKSFAYEPAEQPILLAFDNKKKKVCLLTASKSAGHFYIIEPRTKKSYCLPKEIPAPVQAAITSDFTTAYFVDASSTLYKFDLHSFLLTPLVQPDAGTCIGITCEGDRIYTAWEAANTGMIAIFDNSGTLIDEFTLEGIPTNIHLYNEDILVPFTSSPAHGEGIAVFAPTKEPRYLSFHPAESVKAIRTYPCNLTIDSAQKIAYVINEDIATLTYIDLTTYTIQDCFPIGHSITSLYLFSDTRFAIATSNMFADLTVVDLVNKRLLSISNTNYEFSHLLLTVPE